MKKVIIANDLKRLYFERDRFLDRADIKVFTAGTNDEILNIHVEEKADLIVTMIDLPGLRSEELFDIIKKSKTLQDLFTILTHKNNRTHRARCLLCNANAVFTLPDDADKFVTKTQQLLNVAPRRAYRVALNVAVEGKFKNRPFLYHTENISSSGILIKANQILVPGDQLSLSFYLPDGTRISARARIERIAKHATAPNIRLCGIQFIDIAPDHKAAIESFIEKTLQEKYFPNIHAKTDNVR